MLRSLKSSVTSLNFTPKLVKVNLQDFASRDTRSGEQSGEVETPLNAPIPYANKPPSFIQESNGEKRSERSGEEGYNLVAKYRRVDTVPRVVRDEPTNRKKTANLMSVSLAPRPGIVPHSTPNFHIVSVRLKTLGVKSSRQSGKV